MSTSPPSKVPRGDGPYFRVSLLATIMPNNHLKARLVDTTTMLGRMIWLCNGVHFFADNGDQSPEQAKPLAGRSIKWTATPSTQPEMGTCHTTTFLVRASSADIKLGDITNGWQALPNALNWLLLLNVTLTRLDASEDVAVDSVETMHNRGPGTEEVPLPDRPRL